MNCLCCQEKLFEYLDGDLSASAQSEMEAHLERCAACRQAAQSHQALAARFRRETDSLVLRPATSLRIEAALFNVAQTSKSAVSQVSKPAPHHIVLPFWRRFAWPAAIAAALLVATGLSFRRPMRPGAPGRQARLTPASATISTRFSSCDPTYTFRWENDQIVDALTCAPRVVEENLSLSLNQKHIPQTQERKTPL